MVLKDFQCRVSADQFDRFSIEQQRWAALVGVPGFVAQCGGRVASNPEQIQIFGLWEEMGAYRGFMSGVHDQIFDGGTQGACYTQGRSALYELVCDMPGTAQGLGGAIGREPVIIRVARCVVKPARVGHFVEMQRTVWRPGMERVEGMLGGGFWRSVDDEHRFIVTTVWASIEDHERYRQECLPALRAEAEAEIDLDQLDGEQVFLSADWTVCGA